MVWREKDPKEPEKQNPTTKPGGDGGGPRRKKSSRFNSSGSREEPCFPTGYVEERVKDRAKKQGNNQEPGGQAMITELASHYERPRSGGGGSLAWPKEGRQRS